MASENETVAEIVREMRDGIVAVATLKGVELDDLSNEWADRIEAAHKREVDELRKCLKEALASEYGRCRSRWPCALSCALCSKNCNVKRWRNTLEGVSK